MKKSKPKVWLARDAGDPKDAMYGAGFKRPKLSYGAWKSNGSIMNQMPICPEEWERIAPKSCHLKPGEGPIEITVDIKRVKK